MMRMLILEGLDGHSVHANDPYLSILAAFSGCLFFLFFPSFFAVSQEGGAQGPWLCGLAAVSCLEGRIYPRLDSQSQLLGYG